MDISLSPPQTQTTHAHHILARCTRAQTKQTSSNKKKKTTVKSTIFFLLPKHIWFIYIYDFFFITHAYVCACGIVMHAIWTIHGGASQPHTFVRWQSHTQMHPATHIYSHSNVQRCTNDVESGSTFSTWSCCYMPCTSPSYVWVRVCVALSPAARDNGHDESRLMNSPKHSCPVQRRLCWVPQRRYVAAAILNASPG